MGYDVRFTDKEYNTLLQGICEAIDWNIENKRLDDCNKYYSLMSEMYKQTGVKYKDNVHDCTELLEDK